jgi:hypothetical protein
MARIFRTFTIHLFDAGGTEPYQEYSVKTLDLAQRDAALDLQNNPDVLYAAIVIDRFNGSFYTFERTEIVRREESGS